LRKRIFELVILIYLKLFTIKGV